MLDGRERTSPANGATTRCPGRGDDERPGRACYCGRRGCIETFLSGPGSPATTRARPAATLDAHAHRRGAAAAATPAAVEAMARYVDRLARALATIINVLDPDVIVLGGGLSNIERRSTLASRHAGATYVFSDEVHTRLVTARHGDSSGVRGAAWLW